MTAVMHPSVDERIARGKEAREQAPPSAHAEWAPAPGRPNERRDGPRDLPSRLVGRRLDARGVRIGVEEQARDSPAAPLRLPGGDRLLRQDGAFGGHQSAEEAVQIEIVGEPAEHRHREVGVGVDEAWQRRLVG